MKSILEEFACGDIDPYEITIRKGSHHEDVLQLMCEREDRLMSSLDDELKETLKQYIEALGECNSIESNNRFINGYRLGVLMTIEVFRGQS